MARDLKCAEGVGEVSRLGGFDTQFIMYGCGYVEEGKIKYRVSSKAMEIYKFIQKTMTKGICPTIVMKLSERGAVPPDVKEEIAQELKVKLASEIKGVYSKEYFYALETLNQQPPNNSAYQLLLTEQEKLEGIFDEEKLIKLDGLARLAYQGKTLTKESYEQLQQWIGKNRAQMDGKPVVKEAFEKRFYGFAYEKDSGKIDYVVNALEEVVWEKKALYDAQGLITTAIVSKHFWSANAIDVSKARKAFLAFLKQMMDEEYMELLREIKSLPSAIDQELFEQQLEVVKQKCSEEAVQGILRYGYLWNIRG